MNQPHDANDAVEPSIQVGVFDSEQQAEKAIEALQQDGFSKDELSVIQSNADGRFTSEDLTPDAEVGVPKNHALVGSLAGAGLGGLFAAAALTTIGGLPVVIAGGMGAMLTGGVAGGLGGAMMNRGLKKESVDYFEQAVANGKIVVAVEPADGSPSRLETAARTMSQLAVRTLALPND